MGALRWRTQLGSWCKKTPANSARWCATLRYVYSRTTNPKIGPNTRSTAHTRRERLAGGTKRSSCCSFFCATCPRRAPAPTTSARSPRARRSNIFQLRRKLAASRNTPRAFKAHIRVLPQNARARGRARDSERCGILGSAMHAPDLSTASPCVLASP